MNSFVDHIQILPVPSVGGVRQPDGDHRPGGLGMLTLADRLADRGWTARVEDIGFEGRLPERRIAESYARSIGDAVLSAWDRDRFPVLLSRVQHGALGVVDALGERTGLVWWSPRSEYRRPRLLRRPPVDRTALAMVTGRVERDRLAVQPVRLPGSRIVVIGGGRAGADERESLAEDGVRVVDPREPAALARAVEHIDADGWYVHVDVSALDPGSAPAADETSGDGITPADLEEGLGTALAERPIRCVGFCRYDLNRDRDGQTARSLTRLIDRVAILAGGQPRPTAARSGSES